MTREEAIEMIASMGKYMSSGNPIWKTEPVKEATDMAIEALKEKNRSDSLVTNSSDTCKESESKLDLISRAEAVALVNRAIRGIGDKDVQECLFDGLRKQMWALPSAICDDCIWRVCNYNKIDWEMVDTMAEPKTGEWIQKDMYADRFCSECDYAVWDSEAEEYNFCPNCGARMEVRKNDKR